MAEPDRRGILRLIWRDELPVGELASRLDLSYSGVSQHLARTGGTAHSLTPCLVVSSLHGGLKLIGLWGTGGRDVDRFHEFTKTGCG